MSNNERSVFDRLNSIEESQSITQNQNEQIMDTLKDLQMQMTLKSYVTKGRSGEDVNLLPLFLRSAKKEYLWIGTVEEFKNYKKIVTRIGLVLAGVGVISTIITTIACKIYTTFTFFENFWLMFAMIMLWHSRHLTYKITDKDLEFRSIESFVYNEDLTLVSTGKEKKRFMWFRVLSYISIIFNIICAWIKCSVGLAIVVSLFEVAFFVLSIVYIYFSQSLHCYGNILFTGRNQSNTATIELIYDPFFKKLMPYDEYKKKYNK